MRWENETGIDTNIIISSLISNSARRYIQAKDIMKDIDPDDAPFLALAMKTKVDGIWSEDKGFHEQNHVKYTLQNSFWS